MNPRRISWYEATARARIAALVDAGSFREACGPGARLTSPHLAALGAPVSFDDGIAVGAATLGGRRVLVAAQEGQFNGGAVGEVHGAKLRGLLDRAVAERPAAVLLLVDSGGVRLHEANAGLIAISEVMRALLAARAAGVPVIALVGGSCGAFGGMGIVTRLCSAVVMSEEGRLSLSGPEVIETVRGVEEFDARDRALVWRVTGGKLRRALGEATLLVEDDAAAFRAGVLGLLGGGAGGSTGDGAVGLNAAGAGETPAGLAELRAAQAALAARLARFGAARDGLEVWRASGFDEPARVPMLSAAEFNRVIDERPADWLASGAPSGHATAAGAGEAPGATGSPVAASAPAAPTPDDARALFDRLFGAGRHHIAVDGDFVAGEAEADGRRVHVIGSWNRAAVDVTLALRIAGAVLDAVAANAGAADGGGDAAGPAPIVFIASTSGQALSRRDELLGVNGFFAHIARCVDLARRRGHRTLALVHGEAVSGGFLAFGLLADRSIALPGAQVRVMDLRAMSRVTKIPLDDLQAFAQSSPVFAPGADNYARMGAIREVWPEDGCPALLADALAADDGHAQDERARLGAERGGRRLAAEVAARVAGSMRGAPQPTAAPVGAAA